MHGMCIRTCFLLLTFSLCHEYPGCSLTNMLCACQNTHTHKHTKIKATYVLPRVHPDNGQSYYWRFDTRIISYHWRQFGQ